MHSTTTILKTICQLNNMEELVSIIMSAYNAEKTLKRAVDSVINQSYQNWELLIIDDCSTDTTADIISEYVSKDSRVKYIKTPRNGGCGKARQYGLKYVKGEWYAFIDSDDSYNKDIIKNLYEACKQHDAKLAHCSVNFIYPDDVEKSFVSPVIIGEFKGDDRYIKCLPCQLMKCMWNGLSHKSLWRTIKYSTFKCLDDINVGIQLLINTNKSIGIEYAGYNYFQYGESVFHSFNADDITCYNLAMWLHLDAWEQKHSSTRFTKGGVLGACKSFIKQNPPLNSKGLKNNPQLLKELINFIADRGIF